MGGPLQGVRVFDMTHAAVGPWGTMILAAMGANVVKIETPGGDPIRQMKPRYQDLSTVYMHCNLGKKGIYLDLKSLQGKEAARTLLRDADVFAENMKLGTVDRLGLSYEEVSTINPRIVYGNYQGYGSSGPLKSRGSVDQTANAFSGAVSVTGRRDGEGEFRATALHDLNAGSYVVISTLLGLLYRERTGRGIAIESPQLGASVAVQASRIAEFLATGENVPPMGSACTTTVPHRAFLCQDMRWLAVGVVTNQQWRGLCRAIGDTDLLEDTRFAINQGRVTHREDLEDRLHRTFSTKPARWWTIQLRKHKVPVSLIYDYETIPHLPQVRANRYLVDVTYPRVGTLAFGNIPFQYSKTSVAVRPGPWPGQDTERVMEEGWGEDAAVPPKGYFGPKGSMEKGVLDGVTVVDMTQGLCGPFASLLLADAGARVIKVEPLEGDYTRQWEPTTVDGLSAVFVHLNRNKEGIRLDIRKRRDRQSLQKLLEDADVFLEEDGQARMKRLGLSYQDLERMNPGLIHCTVSAFGTKGPLRNQPASELVLQAMSDTWAWCDYLNSLGVQEEEPVRLGPDMASMGSSLYVVHGILGALYHKWRTDEGQHITVNMLGTLLHQRGDIWTSMVDPDEWAGFRCEAFTSRPEYGYKTADRRVILGAVKNQDQLRGLLQALGMEAYLGHPLFERTPGDIMGIMGSGDFALQAKPVWEEAFAKWKAEELVTLLDSFSSISGVVNTYQQLFSNPQMNALAMVKQADHPEFSRIRFLGPPWRLRGIPTFMPEPYRELVVPHANENELVAKEGI